MYDFLCKRPAFPEITSFLSGLHGHPVVLIVNLFNVANFHFYQTTFPEISRPSPQVLFVLPIKLQSFSGIETWYLWKNITTCDLSLPTLPVSVTE